MTTTAGTLHAQAVPVVASALPHHLEPPATR
jgi:hypothetical protein